jgi:FMN phosphatase YigB (HAD superfamily)
MKKKAILFDLDDTLYEYDDVLDELSDDELLAALLD